MATYDQPASSIHYYQDDLPGQNKGHLKREEVSDSSSFVFGFFFFLETLDWLFPCCKYFQFFKHCMGQRARPEY